MPQQAERYWYNIPAKTRAAFTKTPTSHEGDAPPVYGPQALALARKALAHEIAKAKEERHAALPFKVSPLVW